MCCMCLSSNECDVCAWWMDGQGRTYIMHIYNLCNHQPYGVTSVVAADKKARKYPPCKKSVISSKYYSSKVCFAFVFQIVYI